MKTKNRVYRIIALFILLGAFSFSISCTSKKKVIDDDFAVDSADAGLSNADLSTDGNPDLSVNMAEGVDEFAEFEDAPVTAAPAAPAGDTASLEQELNSISDAPPVAEETPPVEPPPTMDTPPETQIVEAPPAQETATPEPSVIAKITNIQYKGNSNGGTVIINSDAPLAYTTRVNSSTNQVVVEVQNAIVPSHLKRPLNTKDMSSSIGNVDIYQKNNSNVARFVVQLRPNSPEPLVQPEGNSLLIIGSAMDGSGPSPTPGTQYAETEPVRASSPENNAELNSEMAKGIMNSDDLEEFLNNNNKFYGKPISIETTKMDVREILKFISEESGVNMIFDDDVAGNSALKLRKVPWDQALVILLKSKKLGYRRQGSILRIAKIDSLIQEDEAAVKLKESKAVVEPLIVRNFSINYADIDKLETKIKEYIAETKKDGVTRGRVTSDSRTNTLIITETASKLDQVALLIKALDTQPQQVMIEARIIEASDKYTKTIGGSLGLNRGTITGGAITGITPGRTFTGTGTPGDQFFSPSLNVTPGLSQGGSFLGNIFFGTLGSFGNLDAQLALDEIEDRIKILSSPRVAVLTNTSANINQGGTILQRSTAQATTAGAAPVVTFVPVKVGVTLKVTPQVSNIGTVRLKLDVSRTSAVGEVGATDDRSVTTEVIVKSGDTAVIGGVFQSDIIKRKSGVPGLKDVPLLGTFFKGESEQNYKTELMIFVTPKVIPLLNQVFKAEGNPGSTTQ